MGLFTPSVGKAGARPSVAQVLVREVHVTALQVFAYLGLFAVLGLGVMEFVSSPHLERAAAKLLSSPARADWLASTQAPLPMLRGRQ
jgi:hypothetical protein